MPKGVDAFFLIDEATRKAAHSASLEVWRQQGWWVLTMLPLIQGTAEVSVVPGWPLELFSCCLGQARGQVLEVQSTLLVTERHLGALHHTGSALERT